MLFLRHSRIARVAVALLLTLAATRTVDAQPAPPRAGPPPSSADTPSASAPSIADALRHTADRLGLWGSVGLGRASAGLSCSTCADESTRAYALEGKIGVRLTSRFFMGAETFAWLDVFGNGIDRIARGSYIVARLYPLAQHRLFVHGGLGVASFRVYDDEIGFMTRSPSMSLATGYDWRIGNAIVTPAIAAVASTGGELRSSRTSNAVDDNARLTMLRTSVSFSWFR